MPDVLVDSNILLDVFENDPTWYDWSVNILNKFSEGNELFINQVIYTEISIGFEKIELLENSLFDCGLKMKELPKEALFLAGKAFLKYRKQKGNKTSPLPDFYVGAHAAVSRMTLMTRDVKRIKFYFPTVKLICP